MSRLLVGLLSCLIVGVAGPARAQQTLVIPAGGGGFISLSPGGDPQFPGQPAPARDAQQPAQPGTATLRGRVYAADTGQPLRKAQVRITSNAQPAQGQPPENRLTTTDASGNYEFRELRAGRYSLNAQKGSYVSLQWGQQRPNEPGKPLDILDGQTIEKVDFSLPKGGVITGRILDEFGEPISDVQVAAMRFQNINGGRRLVNTGRSAQTNDIGEFRLFALAPGDYYVSATLRTFNPLAQSDDRSGYAPTYYPGTPDVAGAQKLSVAAGQTLSEITLSLLPIRTARITGTAVDSQGRPMRGIVQTLPRDDFFSGPINFNGGQIRPDGSFVVNGLAPGDYSLQVQNQPGPGGPLVPGEQEFASAEVTVGGSDVTGVRLVAAKPSTIAGKIVIGAGDATSLKPLSIRISAFPLQTGGPIFGPFPQPVAVSEDWTFQARARAGTMRLQTQGLQPPWNIRAVRVRGSDVTDAGIEVKANEDISDVEIEITNKTTEVSGLVTNARGETMKDYWAVLFPRDREKRKPPSRYVRVSRPDQDGRFKVTGLPPGDYLAFAGNAIDPGEANTVEFLDRIERQATRVSLNEGETKTLDLKLSPVP